jgi:hypothetical protein
MEAMKEYIDRLGKDRIFTAYLIAVTLLYFIPLFLLAGLTPRAGIAAMLTWGIFFITLYMGSLHLFFIARSILVKKQSVLRNFKRGLLLLAALTLAMLLLEVFSGFEALRPLALPAYLLVLLYSWNILYMLLKMGHSFILYAFFSYFFILSLLAFYELAIRIAKNKSKTRIAFAGVFSLLSIAALYYYLAPIQTPEVTAEGGYDYALEVNANPVLDAIATIEVLRFQGLEARWQDTWEHGPVLVRGDPEQIAGLRYTWIEGISGYEHEVASLPGLTRSIPKTIFRFLLKNYLWLILLTAAAFFYTRGFAVRGREFRRLALYALLFALLFYPLPATAYFSPSATPEEYLDYIRPHLTYFSPSYMEYQSYPEGGGGVGVSEMDLLPGSGLATKMKEKYEEFVTYDRIEKVQGSTQAIYALYMSLTGALVYSHGYGLILAVLLLYRITHAYLKRE